jgi:hypothetical protein
MKKMLALSIVMAASLLFSTAAVSVDRLNEVPESGLKSTDPLRQFQKDQCLIVAKNCVGGDDSVLKRVERLNNEINKGAATYTPEELQQLHDQLNWIYYESDQFPAVRL